MQCGSGDQIDGTRVARDVAQTIGRDHKRWLANRTHTHPDGGCLLGCQSIHRLFLKVKQIIKIKCLIVFYLKLILVCRALSAEYASKGILIQSLCPTSLALKSSTSSTWFPRIKRVSLTAPSPDTYVNSAIKTIATHTTTNGYFAQNVEV